MENDQNSSGQSSRTDSDNLSGGENRTLKSQIDLKWYGGAAVVLMMILTAAILTPDYFSYKLKMEALRSTQSVPSKQSPPSIKSCEDQPQPAGGKSQAVATAKVTLEKAEDEKKASDPSQLFETYGKLLTMLLGFVSVLGVFVGYFVRKSLREIQDDISQDVEKRMKLWEEQKTVVMSYHSKTKKKMKGLTKLYDKYKQVLDAMEATTNADQKENKAVTPTSKSAADALDSDPTLSV